MTKSISGHRIFPISIIDSESKEDVEIAKSRKLAKIAGWESNIESDKLIHSATINVYYSGKLKCKDSLNGESFDDNLICGSVHSDAVLVRIFVQDGFDKF